MGVNRSSFYYQPKPINQFDLDLMQQIDKIYTDSPYYGYPKITAQLKRNGLVVNHKKVARLMREMGLQAIIPKRNPSKKNINHAVYPYLLKEANINYPNQV